MLKKICSDEKLVHQNTIDQLQVSYELNQELQSVIKGQANTIKELNKQLADKNARLS